ncbi:MAG: aquaporin [Solirubrobacteraceae bacterium]|nr:aquaporin [Solirubrobacteraceae bacterium]
MPTRRASSSVPTRGASAYVAEFVGTLLLVFAIGATATANSDGGIGYTEFITIGIVHAFALTVLIATFGRFSGGNFNPAVTVALLALRKISPANAIGYIVVQILGGITAAFLLWVALTADPQNLANLGAAAPAGSLVVGKDGLGGGFIFEAIGVFILIGAVIATAVAPGGDRRFAPIIIGTALGVANLITAPFTGGALNPARALGPAIVGNDYAGAGGTENILAFLVVYILAPLVAALLAAGLYQVLLGDDRHREVKEIDTLSDES